MLTPISEGWVKLPLPGRLWLNLEVSHVKESTNSTERPFYSIISASTTHCIGLLTAQGITAYQGGMSLHWRRQWLLWGPSLLQLMLPGHSFTSTIVVGYFIKMMHRLNLSQSSYICLPVTNRCVHGQHMYPESEPWLAGCGLRQRERTGLLARQKQVVLSHWLMDWVSFVSFNFEFHDSNCFIFYFFLAGVSSLEKKATLRWLGTETTTVASLTMLVFLLCD